ncbi:diaminopimelate epimerase [Clostridiaceae bacterium 35-E11]
MKLNFIKVNPTENMTVFVADPISRAQYMDVARKIMDYNSIHAEQVGFIEKPSHKDACMRLHMMGGEFCVNATRALATALVDKGYCDHLKREQKFIVPLEVSGAVDVIHCEVTPMEDTKSYLTMAKIPLYKAIESFNVNFKDTVYEGELVIFPGIVHLVVPIKGIDDKEAFFYKVREELKDVTYDALGIMFYDEEKSYMEPLVYVKETDSLIWERGCGSGTAAVGTVLCHKAKKNLDIAIQQPGGTLQILAEWGEDQIKNMYLSGRVEIVAEGMVYL